jgi:hypothetical protein
MAIRQLSDGRSAASDCNPAAVADGDQSAWDRLVERHARRVWSTSRGFALDAAAAADVSRRTAPWTTLRRRRRAVRLTSPTIRCCR